MLAALDPLCAASLWQHWRVACRLTSPYAAAPGRYADALGDAIEDLQRRSAGAAGSRGGTRGTNSLVGSMAAARAAALARCVAMRTVCLGSEAEATLEAKQAAAKRAV